MISNVTEIETERLDAIRADTVGERIWVASRGGRPGHHAGVLDRQIEQLNAELARRGLMPTPVGPRVPRKPGKVITAKFGGKCPDCKGAITAGEDVRFDGKAHHVAC